MRGPCSIFLLLLITTAFAGLTGCSSTQHSQTGPFTTDGRPIEVLQSEEGTASYYSNKFHGRKTASGERYRKELLTAAHRSYPFGTYLRITSLGTGSSVIVRVNDRGPSMRKRLLDLSHAAAAQLGMLRAGIVKVRVEVISWGT